MVVSCLALSFLSLGSAKPLKFMKFERLGDLALQFSDTCPEAGRVIAQCRRQRGNENRLGNRCSQKKAIQLSADYRQAEGFSSQKAPLFFSDDN